MRFVGGVWNTYRDGLSDTVFSEIVQPVYNDVSREVSGDIPAEVEDNLKLVIPSAEEFIQPIYYDKTTILLP